MGWEWHDRRRRNGKFVSDWAYDFNHPPIDQLHIRLPHEDAKQVRETAAGMAEELSEYCRKAIMQRVQQDNRKRATWQKPPKKG